MCLFLDMVLGILHPKFRHILISVDLLNLPIQSLQTSLRLFAIIPRYSQQ